MNLLKYTLFVLITLVLATIMVSCGGDEADNSNEPDENQAPIIEIQSFTILETIAPETVIGTVAATDVDTDEITFSITTNDNDLFSLTRSGVLSLASGRRLDFETAQSHTILVQVSDGELSATVEVTIHITNVDEPFVTTWKTMTADESITIPTNSSYAYDYTVDWGDGTIDENLTADAVHTYLAAGTYTVSISGTFPAIYFNSASTSDKNKIISIEQWGDIRWETMNRAFQGCSKLTYNATDAPDLSSVTDISFMFAGAASMNGDLSKWNVSNVTDMGSVFNGASSFNGAIGNWDVSSVTSMILMFSKATSFNQDLNNWDVSKVTNMREMFSRATSFNGDVSSWNVENVQNMYSMFYIASSFNQDISNWKVGKAGDMSYMFSNATSFNQKLNNWDVSQATNMRDMFANALSFSQDLSGWATDNVTKCTDFAKNSGLLPEQLPTAGDCL